jgi:hypothetical protein
MLHVSVLLRPSCDLASSPKEAISVGPPSWSDKKSIICHSRNGATVSIATCDASAPYLRADYLSRAIKVC